MIKTKQQIYDDYIQGLLPPMFVKMADRDYECPESGLVRKMLKENFIEKYKYVIDTFDCDDYALILHSWVRQEQYRNKWSHPWAFGEVWGRVAIGDHAMNFVITEDKGLLFIEPQSDEMRTYEKGKDILLYMRM